MNLSQIALPPFLVTSSNDIIKDFFNPAIGESVRFAEGELVEASTCKDYLQVRREVDRVVSRKLRCHQSRFTQRRGECVKSSCLQATQDIGQKPFGFIHKTVFKVYRFSSRRCVVA